MPFWASIAVLSIVQGALVAVPAPWRWVDLQRLRNRWWALLPAASIAVFVLVGSLAASSTAQALTYLALVAVPALAVLALGSLAQQGALLRRGAWGHTSPDSRPSRFGAKGALGATIAVVYLFVLAWIDRGGLAGEGAALVLSSLSCVALGSAIGHLAPARWLMLGILAMAVADAALVIADLLQAPNSTLNTAHPAAGLPRLQAAIFGSAAMGYGDLFIAGLLGGLLATGGPRGRQLRGAALVVMSALAFDLLFFWVDELPATVPVALAMLLLGALDRRGAAQPVSSRRAAMSAPSGSKPAAGSTGSTSARS